MLSPSFGRAFPLHMPQPGVPHARCTTPDRLVRPTSWCTRPVGAQGEPRPTGAYLRLAASPAGAHLGQVPRNRLWGHIGGFLVPRDLLVSSTGGGVLR